MLGRSLPRPLLSFSSNSLPSSPLKDSPVYEDERSPRKWYHHAQLLRTVSLILAPQPSLLYFLTKHYLKTLNDPIRFTIHLLVTYTLTFLTFSSLIICVARDPGPVSIDDGSKNDDDGDDEMGLTQALLAGDDDDFNSPLKWCRACWAPKPERTHHCSHCGRCVLKMDHHCPWLGSRCVGHRTYPAFLHFLLCITLLSIYVALICAFGIYFAFTHPFDVDENTPVHAMGLFFYGCVMALVIGSFFLYHLYLVTTNQTTLEHISPFMLLRYLPPLPESGHRLSSPPQEDELSAAQRRLVKDAHGEIRLYDIGWKKNWAQVIGWKKPYGWVYRLFGGGGINGDGKTFPRNPRSEEMLSRLARELVIVDKDN